MSVKHRISTCLWFNDDGEEAANFYVSLFPNSRIVSVTRYGEGAPMPAGTAMLTRFELDGAGLAALNGGTHFKLSEAVSLVALCDTQQELDDLWTRLLAKGGKESQCGWVKDRFGLSWQVIPSKLDEWLDDSDPKRFKRVMDAIMKMVKIDIAELEKAYKG